MLCSIHDSIHLSSHSYRPAWDGVIEPPWDSPLVRITVRHPNREILWIRRHAPLYIAMSSSIICRSCTKTHQSFHVYYTIPSWGSGGSTVMNKGSLNAPWKLSPFTPAHCTCDSRGKEEVWCGSCWFSLKWLGYLCSSQFLTEFWIQPIVSIINDIIKTVGYNQWL